MNDSADEVGNKPDAPKKVYACFQWPSLSVGTWVRFQNGFFVSSNPELQTIVENSSGFGAQIQEITSKEAFWRVA